MDDPLRAKETFQRVVSEYGAAEDARRAALYLQFIAKRYGDNPKPAPRATEPAAAAPAESHG